MPSKKFTVFAVNHYDRVYKQQPFSAFDMNEDNECIPSSAIKLTEFELPEGKSYIVRASTQPIDIKYGDTVKMSESLKKYFRQHGSKEHVEEFGDCIGTVEDVTHADASSKHVNVRWHPSELRYEYDITHLIKVN